tara:strand:- start:167 stop:391 length:225 start_codon:yes stop_codon:yes gene_type:complete
MIKSQNNIKILDCTLRDGGYYNNWDFSKNLISKYLKNNFVSTKLDNKKIEKNFFYKFDNKTHLRFWSILKRNFI